MALLARARKGVHDLRQAVGANHWRHSASANAAQAVTAANSDFLDFV
jgi:hypothetical protein